MQVLAKVCITKAQRMLVEVAYLQPADTGLCHVVKVCHRRGAQCAAHVQVSNTRSGFALRDHFAVLLHSGETIGHCRLKQHQQLLLQKWVRKNRQALLNIWKKGDLMKPTEVAQALQPVARNSRRGATAMETSFGSHSTGRPRQIKTLLALLTEYWRLNTSLQLHEILERLVPSGAISLDGPNRDDATLIAALSAIPELQEAAERFKPLED